MLRADDWAWSRSLLPPAPWVAPPGLFPSLCLFPYLTDGGNNYIFQRVVVRSQSVGQCKALSREPGAQSCRVSGGFISVLRRVLRNSHSKGRGSALCSWPRPLYHISSPCTPRPRRPCPPAPDNHHLAFCLCGFTGSGYFLKTESYNMWPFAWSSVLKVTVHFKILC